MGRLLLRGLLQSRVRRPSRVVRPQAKATTVTELSGMRMAQMTGDSSPRAAMLMPMTL